MLLPVGQDLTEYQPKIAFTGNEEFEQGNKLGLLFCLNFLAGSLLIPI